MEIALVIDTSAYSAQILDSPQVTQFINTKNGLYLPIAVIAELKAGFANGSREVENLKILEAFLNAPNTNILHITETTTDIYAKIYRQLRIKGRPIGVNDMWIAALCIENNLPLLTLDSDFKTVDNLKLVLK